MSPGRVAGLLLAAGGGSRYGGPKALIVLGGQLLADRGVTVLREGGCVPVAVVLGAGAPGVIRQAESLTSTLIVMNPDWRTGIGSSLRAGLTALAATEAAAVAVVLADMPWVTPAAVCRVIGGADAASLAAATYDGQRDHPVLLGRDHWPGVAALALGDTGARPYLEAHADQVRLVPCEDIASPRDLDTPAQD
ncbi:nucleotidyltransferase family protein [Longispora albida]|uniref:nucleotidyltransferase family protein n=1 Tax=Longispora albida TaxID=203523 RepID=UPI000372D404|nr:NTP transferase domain-containing protein [Longispora albida]